MAHSPASAGFRGTFREDLPARAVYSEAAGIARILPRAVAVPVDAEDACTLVRWAADTRTSLVARGSGSSMAGGAIGEGVIVDLSRLDRIEPVDTARRTIRCGPGAIRDAIDRAARAEGLQFPVDPSSGAFCTVGGMASTNAAGAHTLRHGAMRRWVEALDCVFADGSRAEVRRGVDAPALPILRRALASLEAVRVAERASPSRHAGVRKDSSGYGVADWAESGELVDLLVGGEGTLALFVGLELRLAPLLPHSASLLGAFATLEDAVVAADRARGAGAVACELLDRSFLDVARHGGTPVPAPHDAEAVLLAEVEARSREEADDLARAIEAGFRASGATAVRLALDPETEHAIWKLRHAASPIISTIHPELSSMQLIEDGCVPPARLPEYVRGVRAAFERLRFRGVIFGHAGDANVHVNPLIDVREPDWRTRAEALLDEISTLTGRLGGTLTGEHGDGRLRAPLLSRVWPAEALAHFAAVKRAFDPDGILNPGVKVAAAGARPVDAVKYDPSLPALPEPARAALARVERERAYARARLALLEEATRLDARAGGV
ncbi:MAG TPA: FAD-binding oxidoreductase [Gemmatimonadaceae bacterium]|nr:FAD-binding oxidoreductase [Gemmatimonadaceae bacterium]